MATTRKVLRQRIGGMEFAADMIASTAMTGSSSSQIVDTKLVNIDSTFVGAQVVITSGSAVNDYRWVKTYDGTTGALGVDRAFSAAVANGDSYELHRVFSADDKNDAINGAIREAKLRWPRIVEDTSILMVANQYGYSLTTPPLTVPVDPIALIDKIEWDPGLSGTDYPWNKFDPGEYYIRQNDTAITLQLRIYPPYAGKAIRLTYRVRPAALTNDTTALNPDEEGFIEYICTKATALCAEKRANLASEGDSRKDHWAAMAQRFHATAEQIMAQDRAPSEPGKIIFGIGDPRARGRRWGGRDKGYYNA